MAYLIDIKFFITFKIMQNWFFRRSRTSNQCDQIWQNFITCVKFWKTLAILKGLFIICQLCEPNFVKFLVQLGNFSLLLMAKYWKSNVVIWSHC